MLTAMVMVCSLAVQGDCVKFVDNRGPYATQEKCFARVEEMIRDLRPTLPNVPATVSYKCAEVNQGTST